MENQTRNAGKLHKSTEAGPAPPNVTLVARRILNDAAAEADAPLGQDTAGSLNTRYRVNCDQLESDQVGGLAIRTRKNATRTKDLNVNSEVREILEESMGQFSEIPE